MSRIGKYPVEIPTGVAGRAGRPQAHRQGQARRNVAGPDRTRRCQRAGPAGDGDAAQQCVARADDVGHHARAGGLHGARVSTGFSKTLEITGTGYRAVVQGENLVLNLGYSTT